MNESGNSVRDIILAVVFVAIVGWLIVYAFKQSEDRSWLARRLVISVVLLVVAFAAVPLMSVPGLYVIVIVGAILSALWTPTIGAWLAKPLSSLYDDGSQEMEARPLYSAARAKRNRGRYDEAIAEVRGQLGRYPRDFEGQILLAEIQAENLNDLQGAEITLLRLCDQPRHSRGNVAFALNLLADWHLKYAQDPDAARVALEKIIALYPHSEWSALASQRIGHLASRQFLVDRYAGSTIALKEGVQDIGLLDPAMQPQAAEANPEVRAAELVSHLTRHPLDTEAREELALIYANHYGRPDLAADQLEQLIGGENQPARRVVHWLNVLADVQIRAAADYETVKGTLQRIIELFPDAPAARNARSRLDHLRLELKGNETSRSVKLGSYEQDIGLKRNLPDQL